jgi:hypothetical protein
MIEIIVVALLCTWVSKTARNKGKSVGAYVAMTLGLWFGLEILGVVIGLAAFDEFYPAYGLGLGGAVLGGIIAAVIVSSAKPAPGFVAPGQMPYYPQGQMPYPPGQVPYYPPVSSQPQPQSQSQAAVTPAPAPGSQVCAGCGTPNGPDAAFCFRCGKPLK